MNVFDLQARISLDAAEYKKNLENAAKETGTLVSKIEGLFEGIGKAIATAFSVQVIKDFVSSAVSEFAKLEQLVGGVDTLFGDASKTVQANADAAFQTAGMSANDYMDTATSFAASLITSLGGDTAAAADMVDMAVTDMADNANTMGSNITSIQNAYQGFAKQNYTMLDNLKLGYGGTKSEMARLINDSGVLGDTIVTASTLTEQGNFDQVVSYATVVEAIHKVQSEMGITGRTAEEALGTIEGSVNAAKAAWSNWLGGLADPEADMSILTDNLLDSVHTAADNVIPAVERIGESLGEVFTHLTGIDITPVTTAFTEIGTAVSNIGTAFADGGISGGLSEISDIFGELTRLDMSGVTSSIDGISDAFSRIGTAFSEGGVSGGLSEVANVFGDLTGLDMSGVTDAISGISEAFSGIGTAFAEGGVAGGLTEIANVFGDLTGLDMSGVTDAISGISEVLGGLGATLKDGGVSGVIDSLVQSFKEATGIDLSGFVDGIRSVGDTLGEFAPIVAEKVQEIFGQLQEVFTVFGEYLSAIWPIISPIISGLFNAVSELMSGTFEIIGRVISDLLISVSGGVETIKGVIGAVAGVLKGDFEAAATAIQAAWSGVLSFFEGIARGILDIFEGVADTMASVGQRMWQGLKNGFSAAIDGIKGIGTQISEGFKEVFGINSPSRVFAEYGKYMAQGLEVGWDSQIDSVKRKMGEGFTVGSVDFASSSIGKSSSASINSMLSSASRDGGTYTINLVVDGRTLADVIYDPLNGIIKQKGAALGT